VASDLTITIQESITLPNGNREILQNTKVISGINQTLRRIDTIISTPSGSGIEILRFTEDEGQQTAGSFVKSDVKYIRITNLDSTNSAEISIINEEGVDGEFAVFKLDAGKSLMFGNGEFNSSQIQDYVLPGIWDEMYYGQYAQIDVIRAKAVSGSVQLEYFVASA
jgi:hypothetical protein